MATLPPARRPVHRLAAAVRILTLVSVLMVAVAGIPYVLTVTIGVPWPEQVTSLNDLENRLAQPVSDPFVLKVIALAGWACWTYFMAVLARETLWLLARLPALVRDATVLRQRTQILPAHRAAAALLVGTLLLAMVGMWRLPAAHAAMSPATPSAPVVVAATAPQHVPSARTPAPTHITYTVKPGDTLWDIAERHLGDPLKWPQIYQLSCTIRQSDGGLLSDPDLILPGWRLHLTASNPPAAHTPPPPAPAPPSRTPAPTAVPHQPPPSQHASHSDEQQQADHREHGQAPQQRPAPRPRPRPVTISLGTASAIGITTAAGIAAALGFARWHAARRRTPSLDTLTAPLEDNDGQLGEALSRSNQAHLKARAARQHDPETLPRRTAPAEPGQPGTVTIAEQAGREVRIDTLAQAGGVQLTGPGAEDTARHLAIAIACAAQRLRPNPPRVQLITDQATLNRLLPHAHRPVPAWTVTDTPTAALQAAEHALLEHTCHEQHLDAGPLEDGMPALHVLLLDQSGDVSTRLAALATRATPGQLAVITLGAHADFTRHQLTVATDGTAAGTLAPLQKCSMFLLAPSAATEILHTLYAAHGRRPSPDPSDETEDPEPEATPSPAPKHASPPAATSSPAKEPRADGAPSRAVHIRLFGGFKLVVNGKECTLADTRKEATREFIALLAAHPDGLRGEEIAEKMQLVDDPAEAKGDIENLRRAARRVFRDATGKKQVAFVVLSGQVHRLDRQYISTDIAGFTGILKQIATADSPYTRAAILGQATDIYTGPLCDGADYLWAHSLRTQLHRSAVDALILLAEHTGQRSADPEPALALLNRAADLDPENERVYRRIIELQLALGRDDAAQRTLALLTERLARIDAEPEPAILALLGQVPPHTRAPSRRTAIRR
ncbi:BTAD domain-containing putative transcriptional regulator [Streptomyces sp. NBC_01431]|uniref:BTAD domain-containing putative transcriptional regulator n=1 Tax=Streptomyces sp. NBC_01431 TaxID=2903863 RepID=UPI002E2F4049|nr:BTAD domain-containing putative transcriptional regulator [Streptomyces sp. NBC_01431]